MALNVSTVVAEFVGTFMLVFTVVCAVLTGAPAWNATAIASVLMVAIYTFGPVSGGHLNPAVSVALGLAGKEEWGTIMGYIAAQLAGGIIAGGCGVAMLGEAHTPPYVPLSPGGAFGWQHVMLVEVAYTAMLCFVVLNVAASTKNNPKEDPNHFFALAIGFVIIAGGYAAGPISGAAFNPAVSFGLDVSSLADGVFWAIPYSMFQLIGAVVATMLFGVCRKDDDDADAVPGLGAKLVSEFLGTYMLVLTVGLNVVGGSEATAWSAAAALMCMIYALGNVSGANFNPAVTLAILVRGKTSVGDALAYMAVQLFAGFCAGITYAPIHAAGPNSAETFGLSPGANHSLHAAGVAEFAFTFVLAFVVLTIATVEPDMNAPSKQNFPFALAIGSCVTAGGFAVGAVSGGELNPAVAFGITSANLLSHGTGSAPPFLNFLTLSAYELTAGVAAAVVMRVTHPAQFSK